MKIKLAILEKDMGYLNRIVMVFSTKYADKFEIYSFTDYEVAMSTLSNTKMDVLLANECFDVDVSRLPKRCGMAYFVDFMGLDTIKNQRAICKFQKVDLIYKQILSIYSENAEGFLGQKVADGTCKIIAFASPSGGVGNSSMAAACALHFAKKGKKTIYLNIEKFGSSDAFFTGPGQFDMSDIILAIKSKKSNLDIKLESYVKQSETGVYFYSEPKVALDIMELDTEEKLHLIKEITKTGSYEYMIIDMDFGIDKECLEIYKKAHAVVMIGDGSELSNVKIKRVCNAMEILEQSNDMQILNRIGLIYNKFSNKTSQEITDIPIQSMGGAPVYVHTTTEQVVEQLSMMDVFDKIM